jgi:hypothetical protein
MGFYLTEYGNTLSLSSQKQLNTSKAALLSSSAVNRANILDRYQPTYLVSRQCPDCDAGLTDQQPDCALLRILCNCDCQAHLANLASWLRLSIIEATLGTERED